MSCCKDNSDAVIQQERDAPDGIDPCCSIRGPRCLCLPYNDAWAISALVLSILAFCVSWVWWATFLLSSVALILMQILWCVRLRSGSVYGHAVVAGVTSLASLALGIYVLIVWKTKRWCDIFIMWGNDDDDWIYWDYNVDFCFEKAWGTVALVSAILWAATALCLIYFVKSGRHAEWEKKHSNTGITASTGAVELAVASPAAARGPSSEDPAIADASVLESELDKANNV